MPEQREPDTATDSVADAHHHLAKTVEDAIHRHLHEHLSKLEERMHSVQDAVVQAVPAWARPTAGEPRYPVIVAVIAAIGLQLAIPARLAISPRWLLPAVEALLLLVLVIANPHRINKRQPILRVLSLALVVVATVANIWSATRLVIGLLQGKEGSQAGPLLTVGATVWLTNIIVFALWYWEFDRGGPVSRAHALRTRPDFLFTQMGDPQGHPDWEPTFVDYVYLAFTNATAFSPTDTLPMSRWAKMTMLTQSAVSLVVVALVVSRAVGLFQ